MRGEQLNKVISFSINNPTIIDEVIEKTKFILLKGGVIIYPAKNTYLLGTLLSNKEGINKITEAKRRLPGKQYSALVSNINMAKKYGFLTTLDIEFVKDLMPGESILVVRKKKNVPDEFSKQEFAFVLAKNNFERKLTRSIGIPIIATSCGISGCPNNWEISTIVPHIIKHVDLILDIGKIKENEDYTVLDLFSEKGVNFRRVSNYSKKILNWRLEKRFTFTKVKDN